MDSISEEIYDVIILGAGISGLGTAYNLLRNKKISFRILEKMMELEEHGEKIPILAFAVMFLRTFIHFHLP